MRPSTLSADLDVERRRKVRRTAIILGCVAASFYFGFIVMSVVRAERGGYRAPAAAAAVR